MAKSARGLPENFKLDLGDEEPVVIGDFLDEPPPVHVVRKAPKPEVEPELAPFRPEIVTGRDSGPKAALLPVQRSAAKPSVIRYQLNLTPKSKTMLEDVVRHIRTYSSLNDARTSEVFQGVITLLHNSLDDLDLSALPQRGAWGSVTAKNIPGTLSEAFENAILRSARRRGEPGRYGRG